MRDRARWAGGAVHTVLGVLSLGLLATSVLFDVVGLALRRPVWADAARGDLQAGIAAGVLAAVLSLVALAGTRPGSSARQLGVLRTTTEGSALVLFAGALAARTTDPGPFPSTAALVLSAGGLALGAVAAWLGAELAGRVEG
jgi:uncharacterized membrane protein